MYTFVPSGQNNTIFANQEEHQKERKFREEYIDLLKEFGIDYDERYIFKDVL